MAGYRALLRENRSFRLLWSAQIVSFLGDWFNTIAIYTIVNELSGSGRAFAGVMVAKTLPIFLVTPVVGPLVDRFDRRRLMIASDLVRAVLVVGLVVAHHAGNLPVLYGCLVAMVIASGVFIPAQRAALPQITEHLATANALSGATWSVMLALGAAIGGVVTDRFGTDRALVLDGVTFLVSAAFLAAMPPLPAPGAEASARDRSFVAGLVHLARNGHVAALAALKPLMSFGGAAITLIPIFGTSVFPGRGGPLWVGLLYAARGLGALVGSLGLIRIFGDRSRTLRRMVLVAYPVAAISYFALGHAGSPELAALAYFVAAIASGANWVLSTTLLQRETDPRFLGRVFAVEFGVMTLVFSSVGWIAGTALDVGGATPRDVAHASAWALVLPFVLWSWILWRDRGRGRDDDGEGRAEDRPHAVPPGGVPEVFEDSSEGQPAIRR
ncbi:MAG: MFS transporter [Gemmatimonadetes bacterium]|nr:MFS transporter [Gemmatimonadota bacterium]